MQVHTHVAPDVLLPPSSFLHVAGTANIAAARLRTLSLATVAENLNSTRMKDSIDSILHPPRAALPAGSVAHAAPFAGSVARAAPPARSMIKRPTMGRSPHHPTFNLAGSTIGDTVAHSIVGTMAHTISRFSTVKRRRTLDELQAAMLRQGVTATDLPDMVANELLAMSSPSHWNLKPIFLQVQVCTQLRTEHVGSKNGMIPSP